jgi:hypothetical protein
MQNALKFARLSKKQMGVEMFILAGWQDETASIKKIK